MDTVGRFNSLGVMLDCSRNAVMTVPMVKRYIQILSHFGYNRLFLYTEDTYEIADEPFFGYFRGRYTVEELKEMDDFAAEYGIEMIPCIQTLAHFTALIRWPKFSEMVDIDDIFLIDDERTYSLIEKMISTLRECFRTNKLHIGLDEAYNLGKGKYRDLHGEADRTELFLKHLNKVCGICSKYGFNPMMWSDMFHRISSEDQELSSFTFDSSIKSLIPDNLSLVYWDYYHITSEFHDGMLEGHKALTDNIVYAGGAWKWASFVPNNALGIESNRIAMESCVKNGVKDVLITLWGDDGAECSSFAVLPSLAYIGCFARGITDIDEIKQFFNEATRCNFDDFMLLDEPDRYDGLACNYVINPCKYQLYNDCFMGLYDSGVDEGDGERYGKLAEDISVAAMHAGEYGYIFDTIAKLCSVLELKAEIGIRTRAIYKSGDKAGLETLICDYQTMIERMKTFYNAFRNQWYKESKANGFEVQAIRMGGLIMRMQDCHDRLVDYKNGVLDSIPELNEETIPLIEKKEWVTRWHKIVSANLL